MEEDVEEEAAGGQGVDRVRADLRSQRVQDRRQDEQQTHQQHHLHTHINHLHYIQAYDFINLDSAFVPK